MYFQIKKIILWPRKKGYKPRELSFKEGTVNIITGVSRTGKSAVIPIVDYCLGSNDCYIPVETIRDACEWFGILVQTDGKQLLLARRVPGSKKVSGDMFLTQGREIEVPSAITEKNIYSGDVKTFLNDLAGIPTFRMDGEEDKMDFKGRPSFRDLVAFNFQPQNIVANQNILFYKADTYEHREKLRNIFPYALGAVTPEVLAKRRELKELQNELKRKERELQKIKEVSVRWISKMQSHISIAKELGLLESDIPYTESPDELISILKNIAYQKVLKPSISEATIEVAVKELNQLRNKENDLSLNLSHLRRRLEEMDRLRNTAFQYQEMAGLKRDRLKVSEWIGKANETSGHCPLCGGDNETANEALSRLQKALRRFEDEAHAYLDMPAAFNREYENVRQEIRNKSEELSAVQAHRQKLELSSADQKKEYYRYTNAFRFIGSLDQAIETYEAIREDGELVDEIEELRSRVANLQKMISEADIKARINRALRQISGFMSNILPNLDVEELYKTSPCSIDIKDLGIKVTVENGQQHYLWEIGSGANWVSYHIAMTIALHKLFTIQKRSPVGSFIVYDQPSQVYFPKRLSDSTIEEDFSKKLSDEDVNAVRKIFKVLSEEIFSDNGKWQAIILDHASDTVWGKIPNIHLVEEWREGKKLIPSSWID